MTSHGFGRASRMFVCLGCAAKIFGDSAGCRPIQKTRGNNGKTRRERHGKDGGPFWNLPRPKNSDGARSHRFSAERHGRSVASQSLGIGRSGAVEARRATARAAYGRLLDEIGRSNGSPAGLVLGSSSRVAPLFLRKMRSSILFARNRFPNFVKSGEGSDA